MFINKEGKLFGKVSIVDVFVVIVILIAAFGVYTRFFTANERVSVTEKKLEYEIKVSKVREGTFNALSKKGPMYDATTKEYMGEIKDVRSEDCYEEQELKDGSLVNAKIPDRFDVTVTVEVDGNMTDSGYYTSGNKFIGAGCGFVVSTKYAETTGKVISVKEVK